MASGATLAARRARASERPGSSARLLGVELAGYRACVSALRRRSGSVRPLPPASFFLFGAGPRRPKLVYSGGVLRADGGRVVRRWQVAEETIVPSAYTVALRTTDGDTVRIFEDQDGLGVDEHGVRVDLGRSPVELPSFAPSPWAPVLRALHHEILVHVDDVGPLPNRFVYRKPWYRDGAMVAMVLRRTGNLALLRDWILGLREPFDRNNGGEMEADNPGQLLYLVSLVANSTHPAVAPAMAALRSLERTEGAATFVGGRSDFGSHPVYQTKWAKFGVRALGLADPYVIPAVADSYSSLFWWDFRQAHVAGPRFDADAARDYPYLAWAEDHFYGTATAASGDRDWPLSWEANASQADYEGLRGVAPSYPGARLAAPHTWHAAEMFLLLADTAPAPAAREAR